MITNTPTLMRRPFEHTERIHKFVTDTVAMPPVDPQRLANTVVITHIPLFVECLCVMGRITDDTPVYNDASFTDAEWRERIAGKHVFMNPPQLPWFLAVIPASITEVPFAYKYERKGDQISLDGTIICLLRSICFARTYIVRQDENPQH